MHVRCPTCLVLVCTGPVPYLPLLFQRSFGLRSSYEIDILDTAKDPGAGAQDQDPFAPFLLGVDSS